MTAHSVCGPHRLVLERPLWCLMLAVLSVLVSAWAVYLDPVIHGDAVPDLQAARYVAAGDWRTALAVAEVPGQALLVGLLAGLSGADPALAAQAVQALFEAALLLGFAALAAALGGGRAAQALAAVLLLLYPALNDLRASGGAEAGFWAFYVWSVAGMMGRVSGPDRRGLAAGLLCGAMACLFALDMLVVLLIVPLWLAARSLTGRQRGLATLGLLAAAGATLLAIAGWRQVLLDGAPALQVLLQPAAQAVEGWQALARALDFKLAALRDGFLDELSGSYDRAALLAALVWLCIAGLLRALGPVYLLLAAYTTGVVRGLLSPPVFDAWRLYLLLGLGMLPGHALTGFAVAPEQAMAAALMLLAPVPLILERWWRNWLDAVAGYRWILPVVMLWVAVAGAAGLDLRGQDRYLRQAGEWLAQQAPPEASLYSNSRIVAFYSGLAMDPRQRYSWRRAMNLVQRDQWREHAYLAVAIPPGKAHRERHLRRYIDARPLQVFSGAEGGRVLIFRGGS